jgi:hypothetical protein
MYYTNFTYIKRWKSAVYEKTRKARIYLKKNTHKRVGRKTLHIVNSLNYSFYTIQLHIDPKNLNKFSYYIYLHVNAWLQNPYINLITTSIQN